MGALPYLHFKGTVQTKTKGGQKCFQLMDNFKLSGRPFKGTPSREENKTISAFTQHLNWSPLFK